jgi:RNA polymerase-interacting CarD/CdnL/TRCF family regulator
VRLAVGDTVVSSAHGIGRITGRESRQAGEFVVVEFAAAGLTVALPIERADQQLRAPASESDLKRVQDALRQEWELDPAPWLSRRNHARSKLTSGDPVDLAELIREGATREQSRALKGAKSQIGESEKRFYTDARRRLTNEIAHVRRQPAADADRWIDQQLENAD